MESNSVIRKRRVKAQQNMVTALCLGCMLFTVCWSVFAAVKEAHKPAVDTKAEKTAPKIEITSHEAKPEETDSSEAEPESSVTEETSSNAPDISDGEHPYAVAKDTADDLGDAVFIGDSRTVGMMNSTAAIRAKTNSTPVRKFCRILRVKSCFIPPHPPRTCARSGTGCR